ncbi:MAG: PilW family protein [Nitrospirae bacterium]|nr:PilW family protein [Nitrospirota bacterium]
MIKQNNKSPFYKKGFRWLMRGRGKITDNGFTLIELMITMIAFIIVIASVSSIFLALVNQFKQHSKIAETNLEGLTGLEVLRQDIENAGYGLPWNITGISDTDGDGNLWDELPNYNEAIGTASIYNDASQNAPRAILSGNNVGFNSSDYLVIKSINIATYDNCKKWTTLSTSGTRTWTPSRENVNRNDDDTINNNVRVITLAPGSTDTDSRSLVSGAAAFFTTFSSVTAAPWQPTDTTETRLVYGVDPSTNLRMPFNRADYFISNANVPQRCAPNTGVLVKAVVSHDDGDFDIDEDGTDDFIPLLDCVADMQVIYRRDTDGDGTADNTTDDISALTAQQIRDQVKEVRVYILAHEGQRDINYTYTNNSVTVGEFGLGSNFDLTTITNYQNYRWKVYTIVVNPSNLRSI